MSRVVPFISPRLLCGALAASLVVLSSAGLRAEQGLTFDLSEVERPGIKLTIEPARLVLGAGQKATLLIEIQGQATVRDLRLLTNSGEIGAPQEQGGGRYTASYLPPAQGPPQVALIAALATLNDSPAVAHLALPLAGQGDLELPAKAGEEVTIQIGERTFGPSQADESGLAKLHIEVDPGQRFARWGGERIDLGATDFNLLLASCMQTDVAPGEQVDLRVFVVTPRGAPRKGARLKIKSVQGRVGRVQDLGGGVYGATFRASKKLAGPARIGVWYKRKKASRAAFDIPLASATAKADQELSQLDSSTVPPLVPPLVAPEAGDAHDAPSPAGTSTSPGSTTHDDSTDGAIEIDLSEATAATESPEDEERWADDFAATPAADEEGVPEESAAQVEHRQAGPAPSALAVTLGLHAGFGSNIVALHTPELGLELGLRPEQLVPGLILQLESGLRYFRAEQSLEPKVTGRDVVERQLLAVPLTLSLGYRVELTQALHLEASAGAGLAYVLSSVADQTQSLLSLAMLAHLGITYALGPGELALRLRYTYGGLERPYGGFAGLVGYRLELL